MHKNSNALIGILSGGGEGDIEYENGRSVKVMCHKTSVNYYAPLWKHADWIKNFTGDNMCLL